MAVKLGLLLICFIIGVNSFLARSSQERSLWRDDTRDDTKAKRHDHESNMMWGFGQGLDFQKHRQGGSEEERHEMTMGDDARHGRRTQHYRSGGQGEKRGQKLKIRYSSSSSSSSSEEKSNESHEIRQAQKQYHDTTAYNQGIRWVRKSDTHKHANADLPEFHNTIDNDQ